jgi:hypothetical protein
MDFIFLFLNVFTYGTLRSVVPYVRYKSSQNILIHGNGWVTMIQLLFLISSICRTT